MTEIIGVLLVLFVGISELSEWGPALYQRFVLEERGTTATGVVRAIYPTNSHAIKKMDVSFTDKNGLYRDAQIYSGADQYSAGQAIILRYLPTESNIVQLAPKERGDLRRTEVLSTLTGIIFATMSLCSLITRARRWLMLGKGQA